MTLTSNNKSGIHIQSRQKIPNKKTELEATNLADFFCHAYMFWGAILFTLPLPRGEDSPFA